MDADGFPLDRSVVHALEVLQIRRWKDPRTFQGAASAAEERYQGRLSGAVKLSGGNCSLSKGLTMPILNLHHKGPDDPVYPLRRGLFP